jgi:hypothetical protein
MRSSAEKSWSWAHQQACLALQQPNISSDNTANRGNKIHLMRFRPNCTLVKHLRGMQFGKPITPVLLKRRTDW